ncbi:MAG: M2 family metallopeptidase [Candidatus Acidiferrales bacterium]
MSRSISRSFSGLALAVAAALCALAAPARANQQPPTTGKPTVEQARAFIEQAGKRLFEAWNNGSRADWVAATYITVDTEQISADANKQVLALTKELATEANRFDGLKLPADLARKLKLLKLSLALPPPSSAAEQSELAELVVSLQADYGRGKYCPMGAESKIGKQGECLDINALSNILAEDREPAKLLEAWRGWHAIGPPMKQRYTRFVELANKGAREMGFADTGAMWRSNYDMPSAEFAKELDRLWTQVRPLYESLHAYVRGQLAEKYGSQIVRPNGPIPAHLLGNMWAQQWGNIYDIAAPPASDPGYDLTEILKARKVGAREMVRFGERFFTSLGFAPLPETFWERSLFTKPEDREVVCHASAWDVDSKDDLRIMMCIQINAEDFVTIHHELGHNFYQRAYNDQPPLFLGSANDGFHEAIGDTVALSVTPEYLKQIGLIEKVPGPEGDLGLLMRQALDKVAFLPFGLMVDQWRWKVFAGDVKPADYNQAWWALRLKYQGVAAPGERPAEAFDPGAKYHVPANTPYTRYFLAHILQFQFYRAMCRDAGYTGPLHRCSFYGNKEVGAKLNQMLELGLSRPWPEALHALTGEKQMDATAIIDYFAPLKKWLDEQNAKLGYKVGW